MGPRERAARAAVRIVALAALLVLGMARWMNLVVDGPVGATVAYALLAAGVAGALVAVARVPAAAWRVGAAVAASVALLVGALLAAGVPTALLDPRDWDVLAAELGDGIAALPGVTVPYRGVNEWIRITIAAGGCLLAGAVALTAAWPRSEQRSGLRAWPLLALGVLFAVPGIQLTAEQPWLLGALFAIPLVVFLLAERLPLRLGALAAGAVLTAVLAAMAAAPAIDGDDPVVDVQEIASALQPDRPDHFSWTHGYGPIDWPRDGREVLRVRARRPAYWKAQDLEIFDGVRWTAESASVRLLPIAEGLDEHPEWRQEVRVTVKDLETGQFVAPGETLAISRAPRQPVNSRPGGFSVADGQDPLGEGAAYLAESYVPRPRAAELRAAGNAYPVYVSSELTMFTPPTATTPSTLVRFMPFGSAGVPLATGPNIAAEQGAAVLEASGYAEVYRLAQRLARRAATPYDFVQAVERYLAQPQFVYDEEPPERRLPVPAFLLRDRAGYCQHFSAAMALLLRMGGVPARVAGGFTPGQLDRDRGEYVVRDLDAHSWVEAWFPGIGWVTFDPTPSEAPARSQAVNAGVADSGVIPGGPEPQGAIGRGADVGPGGAAASFDRDPAGTPWGAIAVIAGLGVVAVGGWALWRRRSSLRRRDGVAEPHLAELVRALRRTGRELPAGTTLLQLERRYAGSPGISAYVRALAAQRYRGDGDGPTAADRRALRRDLGRGLGPIGRLRAVWAVPPRPRLH
ncbi:MAG TPA: transglutaminase domain-containing protein [Capillimicrobium sp.]|nr:transglutaminase domain-containing protein [Capillimicrobium sp.]